MEAGRGGDEPSPGPPFGSDLHGKTIAVVGLGASGRAAARLALERGGRVYATDIKTDAAASAVGDELRGLGARVELGRHRVEGFIRADTVVVSPGIPPNAPVLADLRRHGIGWVSELEFAFWFFKGPLIAVTGTNGKTTTAALTAHLLRVAGLDVGLGGNIGGGLGPAAAELALLDPPPDWYVVEASSFQLADVVRFRPDIGVVTNLAPDHLDRYSDTEAYYADKKRFFDNADEECDWVLNGDDPGVWDLAGDAPGRRHLFGLAAGSSHGGGELEARADAGRIRIQVSTGFELRMDVDELGLVGRHNVANALAAGLAAALAGAPADAVAEGLRSFQPLPHRLEPVGEVDGVRWINDSKATNVSATLSACASLDRPMVLLLGGKDKGEDFRRLRSLAEVGVRRVIAYGDTGDAIAEALGTALPLTGVDGGFDEAVAAGQEAAEPGDILLLSPACSSYDMFENYEARGRRFSELCAAAGGGG